MRAIGHYNNKAIQAEDSLLDLDIQEPVAKGRDLKVAVKAVSVNPADVKQRQNASPPTGEARILGFDAAGVVQSVGPEATLFKPGDEVFYAGAVDRPGCNSEYHLVDERIVGRKPKKLSFDQAVALPLTSITAWELLFNRLCVAYGRKDQSGVLLIVNGAGGVGSILTQIARRLTGLKIIATASRPETTEWCYKMGAHSVINHLQPLSEGLKKIGIESVEYVAGLTATEKHLPEIVKIIAPQGKLALIDDPKVLDIAAFKSKSVSVHWEFMFTRSLFHTPDMIAQHQLLNEVADLVDAGLINTTMNERLTPINAANMKKAHALVESGRTFGKVVLADF